MRTHNQETWNMSTHNINRYAEIVYYLTSAGSGRFRTSSKRKKNLSTIFSLFLLRVRRRTLPARVKYDAFLNECVECTSMHCFLGRTNCYSHIICTFFRLWLSREKISENVNLSPKSDIFLSKSWIFGYIHDWNNILLCPDGQ